MSSSVYIPSSSGGGGSTPPTSISIKTASYTIPAGKYASITNIFGDLTVDGQNHYITLQSFSRSLAVSTSATDIFYYDSKAKFVKVSSSSTVSNVNNITACAPSGFFFNGSLISGTHYTGFNTNYYFNGTFTGNRSWSWGSIPSYASAHGSTSLITASNPAGNFVNFGGFSFFTQRVSGTVTHSGIAGTFSEASFFVPSGTVLSGSFYSVEEYTV